MRQDSLYDKNLSTIRRCRPYLTAGLVSGLEENISILTCSAKSGLPILEVKREAGTIPLHSKTDPAKEAKRWADGNIDGEEQVIFLFGFGIGYHVEELLGASGRALIVVFEPSGAVFQAALGERDLTTVLESDRVQIVLGDAPAPFDLLVSDPSIARVKLLSLRSYQTLFPDSCEKRRKEYVSWLNRRQINTATIRRFDRLWTSNTFRNSGLFFSLKGIEVLKGKLRGIPAIVVCAGPSLEQDIVHVREVAPNAVIFAVDTALRPVMQRGVVPDFVVSVDPQWVNSLILLSDPQLRGKKKTLPVLVSDPAVYPSTLREYSGIKVISSSVFAPGRIIERFSGTKGTIAAGGSVAIAAYDLARITGTDPILLLGLDLSYSNTKTHLSGSFHEIYLLSRANRLDTVHTQMARYIAGGDPFYADDKNGNRVLTDRRMMLYRSWFENQVKDSPARTINASSGGINIDGIDNIPIDELRADLMKDEIGKETALKELREELYSARPDREGVRSFLGFLEGLKQKLEAVYKLASRGALLVKRAGSSRNVKDSLSTISRELEGVDSTILADRDASHMLSMVMQTPIVEILGKVKADVQDIQTTVENSQALYSSIAEGAEFLLRLLDVSSKRIKQLLKEDVVQDQ
jgi:hypothetical protein